MAVLDYVSGGGFGMGSYSRAKAAGYSDLDIYNALSSWGGTIGDAVRANMNSFNQSQAQAQQGLGLQSYQRALASGQSAEDFFNYARNSGLTIGAGLQAEMDKSAAPNKQLTIREQAFKADTLRGALKILGNRNIGANTLEDLAKKFKTTQQNIVKQIDIVNKNQGTQIGLGSNSIEQLAEVAKRSGWVNMGDGKVGSTAQSYVNAINAPTSTRTPQGGWKPTYNTISPTIGQKLTSAGLAPLQGSKMVVDNRGNYVPRVSGNYGAQSKPQTTQQAPVQQSAPVGNVNQAPVDIYQAPSPTIEEMPDPKYGPGGPGAALDGGATGFRARRSRWRSAGKTTKGTANLKIMGQSTRSSGVNLG